MISKKKKVLMIVGLIIFWITSTGFLVYHAWNDGYEEGINYSEEIYLDYRNQTEEFYWNNCMNYMMNYLEGIEKPASTIMCKRILYAN